MLYHIIPGTSQPTRNPSSASPRNLSVDTAPGTPGVKRRISRRVSFAAMARKPSVMVEADGGGTGTGTAPTELPVSNEVLNSLGPFCFPGKLSRQVSAKVVLRVTDGLT